MDSSPDPRTRIVTFDAARRWRCSESGDALEQPDGWAVLPPGDAAQTRRVKQGGPHWVLQERKGRRVFSRGVCAPVERIERVRLQLERERSTPDYAHRLKASRARRERKHEDYVEDFRAAVLTFLGFHSRYTSVAEALADQVTAHTTPVGSGTVGRTQRIPVDERAAAAVIAWLRHSTTGYDDMEIPRIRGKRREVRRRLAARSRELLDRFRRGDAVDRDRCPLHKAIDELPTRPPRPATVAARTLAPVAPKAGRTPLWQSGLHRPR